MTRPYPPRFAECPCFGPPTGPSSGRPVYVQRNGLAKTRLKPSMKFTNLSRRSATEMNGPRRITFLSRVGTENRNKPLIRASSVENGDFEPTGENATNEGKGHLRPAEQGHSDEALDRDQSERPDVDRIAPEGGDCFGADRQPPPAGPGLPLHPRRRRGTRPVAEPGRGQDLEGAGRDAVPQRPARHLRPRDDSIIYVSTFGGSVCARPGGVGGSRFPRLEGER